MRPARQTDASRLADLWLRARRAAVPVIPPPVHTDEQVHSWFSEVVLPTREVWVAEAETLLALMVLDGPWVDQLYVAPAHTGRGLGSSLLELAMDRRSCLELWVFASNLGARRFYERHGFEAVGATLGDNEEGAPDVHYRWLAPEPR